MLQLEHSLSVSRQRGGDVFSSLGAGTGSGLAQAQARMEAADQAIRRALSVDSLAFNEATEQTGGQ
jgi:hypothetical protein